MSHGKRRSRRSSGSGAGPDAPELNIMPFIDIFSMLNTFLLVSASFLGLGILEVQIPFLSNSPDVKELPQRSFSLRVDVEDAQVKVTSLWTAAPVDKQEKTFQLTPADVEQLHQYLVGLRNKVPENDKLTIYSDDTVTYKNFVLVLDAVKTMKENEPPLNIPNPDGSPQTRGGKAPYLYEKVVVGSVIL